MNKLKWIAPALLAGLFLLHLPFIEADPDKNISFSRGPFTDEGLNSIQLRNFIDHGYLDIAECDNLLKTPFFNLLLAAPYALFGTDLQVGRLTVLILALSMVFLFSKFKEMRWIAIIFALLVLLQYHVFQFSHFALAEILSSLVIILSISLYFFARRQENENKKRKWVLISVLLLSTSYYLKIQFIYVVALPFIAYLLESFTANPERKDRRSLIVLMVAGTLGPALVYLLVWYLPNFSTYNFMMSHQSGTFGISDQTYNILRFNIEHLFLKGPVVVFSIFYPVSLIIGIVLLRMKPAGKFFILFTAAVAWNIIESHKLLMVYLPTRYQLSMIISAGFTISVVLAELFGMSYGAKTNLKVISRLAAVFVALLILSINSFHYSRTYQNRSFQIREVNSYIAENTCPGDLVIGAWAPSFTWDSDNRSFPVWDGFLNYKDPVKKYRPLAVISEPDEEDSNQAYTGQGIDLDSVSDSTRTFRIGQWDVSVFWLNKSSL